MITNFYLANRTNYIKLFLSLTSGRTLGSPINMVDDDGGGKIFGKVDGRTVCKKQNILDRSDLTFRFFFTFRFFLFFFFLK
jgi:hypothetical protein